MDWVRQLRESPIAIETEAANEQHYEVPGRLLRAACSGGTSSTPAGTGPRASTTSTPPRSPCSGSPASGRALANGQRILELGCGWGSLTLWMAEHYPDSQITAVSNSASQKAFIDARAADRGLSNVTVVTADMNRFAPAGSFDRVVSVEMFEHMRNYETLLCRIASWLEPGGRLFVHIFSHSGPPTPTRTAARATG